MLNATKGRSMWCTVLASGAHVRVQVCKDILHCFAFAVPFSQTLFNRDPTVVVNV